MFHCTCLNDESKTTVRTTVGAEAWTLVCPLLHSHSNTPVDVCLQILAIYFFFSFLSITAHVSCKQINYNQPVPKDNEPEYLKTKAELIQCGSNTRWAEKAVQFGKPLRSKTLIWTGAFASWWRLFHFYDARALPCDLAGHKTKTNKMTADSFEIANELPRSNVLRFIPNTQYINYR